jgi:hypothetical protein
MTNDRKQRILCSITDDNGEYYYNGPLDGLWGAESQKAADRFLRDFTGENAAVPEEEGTFWDEIRYFKREEFRCKCGGQYCGGFPAEPREAMVRIADQLRKNLGVPITVVSGLRCPTWNTLQGGVENSQHMYGEAADIYAAGCSQAQVEAELDRIGGVRYHYPIDGSSNVHFDIPKGDR